jgi:hypothetical protein
MSEPAPTPDQRIAHLVELLQNMDRTQQETDEDGGREVAWYYYRDRIEDALGVERGTLDTGEQLSLDDVFASVRSRVEAEGGSWPLKAPPGLGPVSGEETST